MHHLSGAEQTFSIVLCIQTIFKPHIMHHLSGAYQTLSIVLCVVHVYEWPSQHVVLTETKQK